MNYCRILILILAGYIGTNAQETDSITVALKPIVITANRIPTAASSVNRSFDVIELTSTELFSSASIEDILQRFAQVNVQSRGVFGAQTDLSIRGTLFSQNLILLNGSRLDDPQTAHHNFDLPLSTGQIERIEIVRGPGSSQYGANAAGGVVNIITRKPEKTSANISLKGGNYGLFTASGTYESASSVISSANNISFSRSSGYRYDTDFSIFNMSTSNDIHTGFTDISLFAGYTKKEFGAFDFYSPGRNLPSKEWTETSVVNIGSKLEVRSIQLIPKISYRRHYDMFMDDIRLQDQNICSHTTNVLNGEITGITAFNEHVNMASGVEYSYNNIISNVYKEHFRNSGAVFASVLSEFSGWTLDAGMRIDFHSNYNSRLCPNAGIGFFLTPQNKIYATAGRSFRAPTYTELYIHNSSTHGDPSLQPEMGWSYETGWEHYTDSQMRVFLSLFRQDHTNLIDYVRYTPIDTAQAVNFSSAVIHGFEISIQWRTASTSKDYISSKLINLEHISINYGYLDSRIEHRPVFSSRYSYNHPRHKISVFVSGRLPLSIQYTAGVIHKIKTNNANYTLVDADFSKEISSLKMYIKGSNLLNQTYEEIAGIPMPGRWLWAGIKIGIL
ncbi:MAG: TonB-dependent receptor [Bacteroidetes bacterium]|nr:TonB-dependent receptor [Bacteroidota bacterium]